jgi:hypothetical protein
MDSILIAGVVFACALGGAGMGIFMRTVLPERHLSADTKEVVKMTMGLVASMTALVLGLLVAASTGEFNTQKSGFQQLAAKLVMLDRTLKRYGPEADPAREAVRRTIAAFLERNWPEGGPHIASSEATEVPAESQAVYEAIRDLTPSEPGQQASQVQAQQIFADLSQTRLLMIQQDDPSIPRAFLFVLGFWLCALFASFGLFSPLNSTTIGALFVGALSVSCAIFLIVDMDQPFEGLIQISSRPLRSVLTQVGH